MVDKRFKNLEFKVGLFVFAALVLLGLLLGTFAVQKQIFVKKIKINILADSGEGLSKSMSVMYSGFQIAKVYSINLRDDGLVLLQARIPKQYTKWIKKDSNAKLVSQGLIGSNAVVFSGGSKHEELENETTFTLQRDKGINALIEKGENILNDVQKIIKSVELVSRTVAENKASIEKIMTGVGDVGDDLHKKEGSVGYLVRTDYLKNEVKAVIDKVKQTEDNVNQITLRIGEAIEKLKSDLSKTGDNTVDATKAAKDMIDKLDPVLKEANAISKNVTKITKDISMTTDNLTDMKKDAEDMLNTSNRLLLNLEEKWPFSSGKESGTKVNLP